MKEKIVCHDCNVTIKKGVKYMEYDVNGEMYHKCASCYKVDNALRNYRATEVYSRVVGYIRPVAQWNKGKQTEYADRKEYCHG